MDPTESLSATPLRVLNYHFVFLHTCTYFAPYLSTSISVYFLLNGILYLWILQIHSNQGRRTFKIKTGKTLITQKYSLLFLGLDSSLSQLSSPCYSGLDSSSRWKRCSGLSSSSASSSLGKFFPPLSPDACQRKKYNNDNVGING